MKNDWDYTKQAPYYRFRPNYPDKAISQILEYAEINNKDRAAIADIGAGTGNLTVILGKYPYYISAIEPNKAMREIGQSRTAGNRRIKWINATGTNTTLQSGGFDLVIFGSSFNVVDRKEALVESSRILKRGAFFSCLWNHRDLENEHQKCVDSIIKKHVPNYEYGTRREDQRAIIESAGCWGNLMYFELDFLYQQTLENYINAWKSVKNQYWNLGTKNGCQLFDRICDEIRRSLPSEFQIKYTCRAWTAKKLK